MGPHAFTVYDMITRGALVYGDAPAVIHDDRVVSFREFRQRVDTLAAGLAARGIGKGDRICVLAQNNAAYLELYGACARQGIIAYPINWRLTADEVERVVERAAPAMMVVDATTLPAVGDWPSRKKSIRHWYQFGDAAADGFTPFGTALSGGPATPPDAEVSPDDAFAVISTAAVDVVPRGAVLTHANVITANLTMMASIGYESGDRYLLGLPLFHVTPLGTALALMHAGGASVVMSRFDPDEAVRLIDRHRVTDLSTFPPVVANLLDAARKAGSGLPSLKRVFGLEAPDTIKRLHAETRARFWTGFGQSETSGPVTLVRVLDKPGAAGRPVPTCQVTLVDDDDREVPIGTPGEIVVRGPLVFAGYFAQPDVTAYTFRNGWHHTGDIGRFDADGHLYYVKRKPEKELIKPGGENVYPAEVETVIMEMDGVTGVCVYGIPDAKWGEAVKAVVEVAPLGVYTAQQVSDFVGSKIARFKRPHAVVFTERLPRAADGAVDREAVKTRWGTAS
ncbi:MAG: AMP-binding protein [Candidatus Rokubacteria bacterium]|nr:AMP-binding protein [Candidatus Rokubacteria bacterium]